MSDPAVSVILSTFDQPQALRYALLGYRRQTFRDFEVVVCDDGSDEETRRVLNELKKDSPYPIQEVWQPNTGYRRSKIANTGVRLSLGKMLVLTDGDCIPHQDFLRLHQENCPAGGFTVGGYGRLGPEESKALNPEMVARGEYEAFLTGRQRRSDRREHLWNILSGWVGKKGRPKVRGCNIGVSRQAYYDVNGYDENFDGFGKEDSDLRDRLVMAGKPWRSLWGRAYVFHIDDVIDLRVRKTRIPRDKKRAQEYYRRPNVTARCANGLVKPGAAP